MADGGSGVRREVRARKGLLDRTRIVGYGGHCDDAWTHRLKMGMVHGTEPYTDRLCAPRAIRDSAIAPGVLPTSLPKTV